MINQFRPDWQLPPHSQIAVRLKIALSRYVPHWPGATDEELDAVAAYLLSGDPERENCSKPLDKDGSENWRSGCSRNGGERS